MTVDVRLAVPADADSVAGLVDAAYREYVPRIGRRPAPMDADYSALVERGQVWVAVDDGYLLGILVLVPKPEIRLYTNAAMAENLAFYPRCGYVETGRAEQDGFSRVFFTKQL